LFVEAGVPPARDLKENAAGTAASTGRSFCARCSHGAMRRLWELAPHSDRPPPHLRRKAGRLATGESERRFCFYMHLGRTGTAPSHYGATRRWSSKVFSTRPHQKPSPRGRSALNRFSFQYERAFLGRSLLRHEKQTRRQASRGARESGAIRGICA
jgi:hypothetical protein